MNLRLPSWRLPCIVLLAAVSGLALLGTGGVAHGQSGSVARLTYPPGWNLVAGPAGTVLSGASGSLYSFPAGAQTYRVLPSDTPLEAGAGYWAYFDTLAPQILPASASFSTNLVLPAGAFVLIGNPRAAISVVYGADVVYIYDAVQGYESTLTLQPGQGAWAYSARGATITIANFAP